MIPWIDRQWAKPHEAAVGDTEYSSRKDGKTNIWRYMWLFPEDTLARWVLIGVVRKRREGSG